MRHARHPGADLQCADCSSQSASRQHELRGVVYRCILYTHVYLYTAIHVYSCIPLYTLYNVGATLSKGAVDVYTCILEYSIQQGIHFRPVPTHVLWWRRPPPSQILPQYCLWTFHNPFKTPQEPPCSSLCAPHVSGHPFLTTDQ